MPWSPEDAKKHSKKVNATNWAKIANSVLRKKHDEGMAIRIANSKAGKKK